MDGSHFSLQDCNFSWQEKLSTFCSIFSRDWVAAESNTPSSGQESSPGQRLCPAAAQGAQAAPQETQGCLATQKQENESFCNFFDQNLTLTGISSLIGKCFLLLEFKPFSHMSHEMHVLLNHIRNPTLRQTPVHREHPVPFSVYTRKIILTSSRGKRKFVCKQNLYRIFLKRLVEKSE